MHTRQHVALAETARMETGWTDVRTQAARALWQEGLSASMIAVDIGNVSRNAVIGKLHRLGVTGRITAYRPVRTKPAQPRRERQVRLPRPPMEKLPPLKEELARIKALAPVAQADGFFCDVATIRDDLCKYLPGDGAPYHFCGRRVALGRYCADHARLCYGEADAAARRALMREQRAAADARWRQEQARVQRDARLAAL